MYAVFKFGKRLKRLGTHYSYEAARSAVRKHIRKTEDLYSPFWETTNPSINAYGFTVKLV